MGVPGFIEREVLRNALGEVRVVHSLRLLQKASLPPDSLREISTLGHSHR